MAKARLNKLTDVLNAIDSRDTEFMDNLPPANKKELEGNIWLLMRYASNISGDFNASDIEKYSAIIMTHQLVNTNFMKVNDHPELQWKLLAHAGLGANYYHELLPQFSKKKVDKRVEMLSKILPNKSLDDLHVYISINDVEDLKELCIEYGYEQKDVSAAFKG